MTEHNLLLFLVQVLVLLVLARSAGELLRHFGQAPIVGEILVGVLLGPTLLGRAFPELHGLLFPPDAVQRSMLDVVSWFGVLFLLLETGLHVDVSAAWRARGPALRIGIIGVLVPLLVGSALSFLLPDRVLADPDQRLIFALFLGTTMAISAMVIIARVLHDLDLVKSDLGLVTLCGYAVNDVLAWVVFSLVLGVATSAAVNLGSIGFLLLFTLAFTALSLTVGLRLVDAAVARLDSRTAQRPGAVLTFVCCLGLACGALTQWVGLTALFGFFLAGIMAGEARQLTERTREMPSARWCTRSSCRSTSPGSPCTWTSRPTSTSAWSPSSPWCRSWPSFWAPGWARWAATSPPRIGCRSGSRSRRAGSPASWSPGWRSSTGSSPPRSSSPSSAPQ